MTEIAKPVSLEEFRRRRPALKNVHREVMEHLSPMDKLAVWVTEKVGSMGFFLLIFLWTLLWLGWNFLGPRKLQFDPPMAFVFWLFISNVLQILLMPLIMVGQNIQGVHSEVRAAHDLEVNVKAEEEIEVILKHLEYQNAVLTMMLEKVSGDVKEALGGPAPDDDKV